MKLISHFRPVSFLSVIIIGCALFFTSCAPVDTTVKPITPEYKVTVKVIDHQSANTSVQTSSKHLTIVSNDGIQFDQDVNSNFTYTFKSKTPNVNLKATLTSNSEFNSSMEIDANGKMHAYHSGSCSGMQFEITDNISFNN